jgi:N-acetylglucosamine-6-phosphate deacetylase
MGDEHHGPLPPLAPFTIAAPHLFDGTVMRGPALVTVSGALIQGVSLGEAPSPAMVALPSDAILAPGFIDIQVNGGGGVLLNDEPSEVGVRRIRIATTTKTSKPRG